MAQWEKGLAAEYKERNRGSSKVLEHSNKPTGEVYNHRKWTRVGTSTAAMDNLSKNRGSAGLWYRFDENKNYVDPQPQPRIPSQEARSHYERGRGSSTDIIMHGGGYPSTRAPKVRPEGEEYAERNKGKGMYKLFNQQENRSYNTPRPESRVNGDGYENMHKNRGTMNIVLDSKKNTNFRNAQPEPKVKPEGYENATKGKGVMHSVLNVSGNKNYYSARGEPRVKPEANGNAIQGRGTMDVVLGSKPGPRPSSAPPPRVKPEAEENCTKNKGSLTNIYYKYGKLPGDGQPNPKVSGEGSSNYQSGKNGTVQFLFKKYGNLPGDPKPGARVRSEGSRNANKNKGTLSQMMNPKKSYQARSNDW